MAVRLHESIAPNVTSSGSRRKAVGVAIMYNLAANFESGVGDQEMSTVVRFVLDSY